MIAASNSMPMKIRRVRFMVDRVKLVESDDRVGWSEGLGDQGLGEYATSSERLHNLPNRQSLFTYSHSIPRLPLAFGQLGIQRAALQHLVHLLVEAGGAHLAEAVLALSRRA